MDLPYHGAHLRGQSAAAHPNGPGDNVESRTPQNISLFQAATQRGFDVVEAFGSIAAHTIRNPVTTLGSVADALLHADPLARLRENERLARRTRLLRDLAHASSWSEYNDASEALDDIEGAEAWKADDSSDLYDVECLRGRIKRFDAATAQDDVQGMVYLIRNELTRDLGGICNPQLHYRTRTGTKFLIEHYVAVVRETLDRIVRACAVRDPRLEKAAVLAELEETRRSYGRTALLLSGGGTLGMVHIGVIKALFEANALPRIISGSSSGSIVAAVLGSTTDDNLIPQLHDFCSGDLAVFIGLHEKHGVNGRYEHFRRYGHVFDMDNLRRVMVDLLGKTTFLEAYNRTRRVLNIAVSTSTEHDSQQVLNYATAPNVAIWSAVVASCALPLGFKAERLLCKRDEQPHDLIPWDPVTQYVDGSIMGDLPASILSAQFNVNHSLVSQVNPHITPFLRSNFEQQPPMWIATMAMLKDEGVNAVAHVAELPPLGPFNNNYIRKFHSILTQRYDGDITLVPADAFTMLPTLMANPTAEFMQHAIEQGQRATWPLVGMIKTQMDVELMIDDTVRRVSEHVSFSPSVSDLRKLVYNRSRASARSSGGRLRARRMARRAESGTIGNHFSVQLDLTARNDITNGLEEDSLSSSRSSPASASTSAGSDDESDGTSDADTQPIAFASPRKSSSHAVNGLTIQTQPNSPSLERRDFFFDNDQASSTTTSATAAAVPPPPMSLMMTPVTPRNSSSPEASYKPPLTDSHRHPRGISKSPTRSARRRSSSRRSRASSGTTSPVMSMSPKSARRTGR